MFEKILIILLVAAAITLLGVGICSIIFIYIDKKVNKIDYSNISGIEERIEDFESSVLWPDGCPTAANPNPYIMGKSLLQGGRVHCLNGALNNITWAHNNGKDCQLVILGYMGQAYHFAVIIKQQEVETPKRIYFMDELYETNKSNLNLEVLDEINISKKMSISEIARLLRRKLR